MRALLLVLTVAVGLVVSALPAQAQLGGLINRARQAARDATQSTTQATQAASQTATQASQTAAAVGPLRPGPTGYLPAVNMLALLNQQVMVRDGELVVPLSVGLVFPVPATYSVVFLDAEGNELGGSVYRDPTIDADGVFGTTGTAREWARVPARSGAYSLVVRANGTVIGAVPITVQATASTDPFRPGSTVVMDGPWRTLGAVRFDENQREDLFFHLWARNDEMGGGDGQFEVALYRGAERIGLDASRTRTVAHPGQWFPSVIQFNTLDGRRILTRADLPDGAYEVRVSAAGRHVKTYPFTMAGGKPAAHPRSALDYEPRGDFLTPSVPTDRGGPRDIAWVEAQ
jgi:hypothetical protein